jgi:hypothetical protein
MADQIQITGGSTSPTIERIRGGTQIRLAMIRVIGVILCIISIGLLVILGLNAEEFKSHASGLLNIVTASIFSLVGFVAGQKTKSGD